jgi:hypothetical protein
VFTLRKRLASLFLLAFSRNLSPHKIFIEDQRLKKLNEIFEKVIAKEKDPIMKARWDALRKCVLWLTSHDGAYRIRLIWMLNEISKNKKWWRLKPWEARF